MPAPAGERTRRPLCGRARLLLDDLAANKSRGAVDEYFAIPGTD